MPNLTLNQAARECGRSKSALLEAIRSGRLSASRDDKKQWQIDPAELFRVYPANQSENTQTEQRQPQAEQAQTALLEAKIGYLEKQLTTAESVAEDLRKDRDEWRRQATGLLTDQRPKQRQAARLGFWIALALTASAAALVMAYLYARPV
jgi:hypothetical protein